MKKYVIVIFLITIILLFQGCDKKTEVDDIPVGELPLFKQLSLTKEEEDYLQEIMESETLHVAMRNLQAVYHVEGDDISGYHYKLIKYFADSLNVELIVSVVDISNFFEIDGTVPSRVKEDPDFSYSPDLLEEVDIYCDTLTPLPWREKLVKFVPFLPIREVIVHSNTTAIDTVEDLNKKTVAFQTDSSYGNTFKYLEEEFDFSFNYVHTNTSLEPFVLISSGEVDATIVDSDKAIIETSNFKNLEIGIPVTEVQLIGWAVKKDNDLMASVLEKYIDYMIESGKLNAYWTEVYDVPFKSYLSYLGALDLSKNDIELSDVLDLTEVEAEYIDVLIEKGVLNVAINSVLDGYNYHLIKRFSDLLGVELKIEDVILEEYFTKEGYSLDEVKSDPSISYTPDLLRSVDIYCASLTALPWRKKLLKFIPVFQVRELIVSNVNDIPTSGLDLDGRVVATITGSSYETSLNALETENNITISYLFKSTRAEGIEAVLDGDAYATVMDSNIALWEVGRNENLKISFPITDTQEVGWAVAKDNKVLASILRKYIEYAKLSDLFNAFWFKEYGYTYFEYIKMLNLFD